MFKKLLILSAIIAQLLIALHWPKISAYGALAVVTGGLGYVICKKCKKKHTQKPPQPTENLHVFIFDLDDVLIKTNRTSMFVSNPFNLIRYYIWNMKSPKKPFYKFLEDVFGKQEPVNPHDPTERQVYTTGDGTALPKIWCDYKKGLYSDTEVMNMIDAQINNYFKTSLEQDVMRWMMGTIFDAQKLVQHQETLDGAQEFIEEVAAQGHTLLILSNASKKAFEEAWKKSELQPIFKHFKKENCLISGNLGVIKPQPEIYEILKQYLENLNKNLHDCVFIDDNYNNIIMARKAGINSIWKDKGLDYAAIRTEIACIFNDK